MSDHINSNSSDFPAMRLRAAAHRAPELVRHGSGTQFAQLDEVERLLGVTLPTSMRQFVVEFGWLRAGSHEVLGIGPQQAAADCKLVTSSIVLSGRHQRRLIVVTNDGGEFEYALPVAPDGSVIDRIVVLPIHGGEEDEGWPEGLTFGQYVSSLLDQAEDREQAAD